MHVVVAAGNGDGTKGIDRVSRISYPFKLSLMAFVAVLVPIMDPTW